MSSGIPALLLQNFRKKNHFHLISYFGSKYQFSSSTINNSQLLNSENSKNIQFPRCVQPIENQSVEGILSSISSNPISTNDTVSILKVLRMYKLFRNVNSDSFRDDKRFKTLCETFGHSSCDLKPSLLVSGLRSLLELGVPPDANSVISAEQSIKNNINSLSAFNIIGCLYFHHKFRQTDLQNEVVSLLIKKLCQITGDILLGSEVLMLVHFLHIFNEEELKVIQQKIIELVPFLTLHELYKILNIFAENSNRHILILNAICFQLRQKLENPDIKEILGILYSFKKLNFYDSSLLSFLMDKAILEIPSVTQPSLISGLLNTCGHLRWKDIDILSACGKWIISHLETCRTKEFVSYILTVAALNYNTPEVQENLNIILSDLTLEKVESSDIWLDTVWSLAVLNVVNKDMLLKVLSPEFYKPLINDSAFETVTNKLKLMNLKAVLKMHHPECVFGCDLFLEAAEVPQNVDIINGRKQVIKVLSNFVPAGKYLCTDQKTDLGIFIDAEFIMDKNEKPLSLSKFGVLAKSTDTKPLPEGSKRIAIMVLFYKDFILKTHSVTGFNDLAIRLLSANGYNVVVVPFDEFRRNNTEVQKAKYLLEKISNCIKEADNYKLAI